MDLLLRDHEGNEVVVVEDIDGYNLSYPVSRELFKRKLFDALSDAYDIGVARESHERPTLRKSSRKTLDTN